MAYLLLEPITASVRSDGTARIRDPRTTPRWHDLSTVPGHPTDVVDVAATVLQDGALPYLHLTVQNSAGQVSWTKCLLGRPVPVTGGFFAPGTPLGPPAYPANCDKFTNETPPDETPPA
ncbi:hypothetical protein AB0G15_02790 [Streptosporangium sp. NPDC023825]|uniref:hypothetical protein n=1 Tax=Streptosporangium sp. NPDC023825 TaxID=3154909 RepID=UPI0034212525